MRRTIETAPRDGRAIILEDDAIGTCDVAHWSPFGEWVGANGEPIKITPTHWYPMPRDESLLQENKESSTPSQVGRARRRLAASSIAATLIAAAFIGLYFRSEVAAYVTRHAGQQDIFRIGTIGGQVVAQATLLPTKGSGKTALPASRQTEANQASAPEEAQPQQSLTEERAQAAQKLTEARRAIEGLEQLRAEAAKSLQSLEQERDKTAALTQEAAAARGELTGSIVQHRHALEEERARGRRTHRFEQEQKGSRASVIWQPVSSRETSFDPKISRSGSEANANGTMTNRAINSIAR